MHDHQHDHGTNTARWRLALAFGITATLLVAEVVGSILTGSLALLVDAGHMLTDAGGLLIALIAAGLMAKPPSDRRTWGFLRAEVLAALLQAVILLAVGLYAIVEGLRRLFNPVEVHATGTLIIGIAGLLANVVSLFILAGGRNDNLNLRAAFLEVANDALGSVAVILSALAIQFFGWHYADAVAGLVIALLILPRAIHIIQEAVDVLLEAAPGSLDLSEVRKHILGLPHVRGVHDLHASRIATNLPVISAHVVVEEECFLDGHAPEILDSLQECVASHFEVNIEHSTFQLEPPAHIDHEVGAHH